MPKATIPGATRTRRSKPLVRAKSNPKPRSKGAQNWPTSPRGKPNPGNLIAIDPGWTTGMAFRIGGVLSTCIATSPDEVLDMLDGADQVVVERFATAGRLSAPGLDTIELVGAIRGFCYSKGIPCDMATPTQRYTHMGDAKRAEGRGKLIELNATSKHEVDALAHLLAWEYRTTK